ncbi:MAG: SMC-Scp complex subunit ScpB [Ignavibacteriales bacterium]|jgi:segregation and condensation protein B|nr:SMC-Scp complex subunit ScpB [Melioribacteraceae bacterium]RJP58157.1 MAG: SMC-Scp complex subunit ScpB [Ignavibacteriales bacterium]
MDKIYNSVIEALIFASDEVITSNEIITAIREIDGDDSTLSQSEIESTIDILNQKYTEAELSFHIIKIAGGYSFATKPENAKYLGFLSTEKSKRRLSQAALETLAIIAYKQPITKPEIESIRGVNSDYMINTLLEKNLITIKGRAETIGRPLLYNTTEEFLKYFGLNKITDLPKPREIEEIMQDEDFLEQKRKIMMNEIEEELENDTKLDAEEESSIE